jgi:asparagine synthase (glutamine-hydrolysing)
MTWDGRLDNRKELIYLLGGALSSDSTDLSIVAAAYEQLGIDSFSRLIGDWAISIWDSRTRSLILAKDFVGTRHLYYSVENDRVTWCTILDPLVLFADRSLDLEEEYIAGWLSMFPVAHLTPYIGIHSVPPSSSVLFRPGRHTIKRYWDFDPSNKLRYRTDAEYEEHFRSVFAKAVQRRLRSDRPVLAELSGGRDSSSIVCVADTIIARGEAETSRLDTISYHDDSEPNWNERPYFTTVEQQRGRTGWHVDVSPQQQIGSGADPEVPDDFSFATPSSNGRTSPQIRMCLAAQGNRVMLSGIGGDETMGGVPTPIPELQDLIAKARFGALAHQLKLWAIEKRKPWFYLFLEATRGFFPPVLVGIPKHMRPAAWLYSSFVKQHKAALTGYSPRTTIFGSLPSFQDSLRTLDALRRQLTCRALPSEPPYEKRYPYLDRNLLEFMFAVPPDQLIRPTQRRSLMRRALVGIVPDAILNRKTKAFIVRSPLIHIAKDWANVIEMTQGMVSGALGIVDAESLSNALQKARRGEEIPVVTLMRTMLMESWLRNLCNRGIVNLHTNQKPRLALHAMMQR